MVQWQNHPKMIQETFINWRFSAHFSLPKNHGAMGGSGETTQISSSLTKEARSAGGFPGSNNDDYAMALGVDSKGELILAGYTGAKANSLGEKKPQTYLVYLGEKEVGEMVIIEVACLRIIMNHDEL